MIKSLRWPGAVTVARCGEYCNIYVGDGVKRGGTSYNPCEPPEVQSDPAEGEEEPEPTPLHEPPPVVAEDPAAGDGDGAVSD